MNDTTRAWLRPSRRARLPLTALLVVGAALPLDLRAQTADPGARSTVASRLEARLEAALSTSSGGPSLLTLASFTAFSAGLDTDGGDHAGHWPGALASGVLYRTGLVLGSRDDGAARALGSLLQEAGWDWARALQGGRRELPEGGLSAAPWFRDRLIPACERDLLRADPFAILALEGARPDGPTPSGACGWNALLPR